MWKGLFLKSARVCEPVVLGWMGLLKKGHCELTGSVTLHFLLPLLKFTSCHLWRSGHDRLCTPGAPQVDQVTSSLIRWTHATSPKWSMRRRWWRPWGGSQSWSRSCGGHLPEARPPWRRTATTGCRQTRAWPTSARKQTSPSSTSWLWPSSGPPLHPCLTSARSFCQTGEEHLKGVILALELDLLCGMRCGGA